MLNRLLVPLDGSKVAEQSLPLVTLLATKLHEPVELLTVIPDVPSYVREEGRFEGAKDEVIEDFLGRHEEVARRYLEVTRTQLRTAGVEVGGATVRVGQIADVILEAAAERGAGVIVMATHGRVGPERWFMGSVADRVLRSSSVPVLVMRPSDEVDRFTSITRLLVALDGSTEARAALPFAEYLGAKLSAPVTLVRTINLVALQFGGRSVPSHILDLLQDEAMQYLEATARSLRDRGLTVDTRFSFLHAADEMAALVRESPNSMAVMTSHGRSGIARTVLGSVTDRVVRSAACPVLVVRGKDGPDADDPRAVNESAG